MLSPIESIKQTEGPISEIQLALVMLSVAIPQLKLTFILLALVAFKSAMLLISVTSAATHLNDSMLSIA